MKPLLISLLLFTPLAFAKSTKPFWVDPDKAEKENPDFLIQGEYHQKESSFGVQVVALGNGKYDAYLLEGGLPGLGWDRSKKRIKLSGTTAEDKVTFTPSQGFSGTINNQTFTLQRDGKETKLPRVTRSSPTLKQKAPHGATVLFDGSSVEHWKNGKITDGLLQATGTTSKPSFKSCHLHLEFRTPYKPHARGQGRGNSGVYFGGRWETQILDSFGLDGQMNECGGIYSIAAPRLNMCLPPLTWQTYDIHFTAAKFDTQGSRTDWPKITVQLNGVTIHENQELKKDFTTAAPIKGPLKNEARPVFLQNHGNPVVFRNIWVQPK